MMSFSGARNTGGIGNDYYSIKKDAMTYDGIFSENYFLIESREFECVNSIEISHAITKHPINQKIEKFIGVMCKSKYDGIGITEQIDLSIAIDCSKSMDNRYNSYSYHQKISTNLDFAKEITKRIINQINEKDRIAITYFGLESSVLLPLTLKSEITKEMIDKMKSIKKRGSTYFFSGLEGAYKQLEKSTSNNKRIIMLTDGKMYKEKKFKKYFDEIKNNNIQLTIILIGEASDPKIASEVCYEKGCNYYTFTKEEDIETYIDNHFNFMCFPHSYDFDVIYTSTHSKIVKCIGVGPTNIDKTKVKEGLKTRSLVKSSSTFPSEVITLKDGEVYTKGGLILLKVENEDEEKKEEEISFQITLKYLDREGRQAIQNYTYSFKDVSEENFEEEVFSSDAIENGVGLYYYAQGFRKIIKLAVSIRELQQNENRFYDQEITEENYEKILKQEKEFQQEIEKNEKNIEKLVEITSYDNFWNVGTFLKEHYKELEGLTENKRGEYLKNMMGIYEPSIKILQKRKENNK